MKRNYQNWHYIKLLFLLSFFIFCNIANGQARLPEEKTITLQQKNIPLEKAIHMVQLQSGISIFYSNQLLNGKERVNLDYQDAPLHKVLDDLFKKRGFDWQYYADKNTILIKPAKKNNSKSTVSKSEFVTTGQAQTEQFNIQGRVTDENGNPLPSVSVVIPGTPLGAMTNTKGEYFFEDAPENADLVISYVGYIEKRMHIQGRNVINVILTESVNELNKAVVIGYGKTTKRFNTGSVATIDADVIAKQPIANVMTALPGRVAGVQITQNNGVPGSNTQIQIRGQGSLNSGTIPLYVIDGVPYSNFNGAQPARDNLDAWGISSANGGTSPFSSINPDDIESISILKDADATAIYGARGANGVVLITTKSGKSGKSKVDVNVYTGTGKVGHFIPMLNTQQYLALRKEAFANDGISPDKASSRPLDLLDWDQNAYTNWQKYLIGGTAHSTNAEISYSGGNENTQYRLSGSYRNDGTVYPGDNWKDSRVTSRFSLDHHSTNNKFGFNFSTSYSYENSFLPSSDITSLYTLPPNYPSMLKDSTGKLIWYPGFTNPLSYLEQPDRSVTTNLISNLTLRYTIIPGLNLKLNSGYTNIVLDQKSAKPASAQNPAYNPVSSAYFSNNKIENWIIEPTVDYSFNIGKGKFNALAGGTFQQNISQTNSTKGTNYSSDLLLGSLAGAGLITSYYPNYSKYKFASMYGRANYNWDSKYLINATFRRDGSSRFGPNNRFGNFWAIGAGWIFSEENFVKDNLPFLSFGKLRGSYGLTGNDQIPNYIYLPLYSLISTPYQQQTGMYETTSPNPNIQWETDKKLEMALELGFLKDRILFTGSYYRDRSGNQLTYLSLPTQTGFNSYMANIPAVIQNKGIELTINTKNILTKNFQWYSSLNITIPQNKLLSFPGLENSFYSNSYVIGQPINLTRLYHYTGIDPQTGFPQYATKAGTGIPDYNTDRIIAPVGHPFYGGLSNDFTYKQWSLSVFVQFQHQNGFTNSVSYSPIGRGMTNLNTSVLNRWQKPGDVNTLYPAASANAGTPIANAYGYYYGGSDAFWGDASWLKIRSASLSYSFGKKLISSWGLSTLRLYAEGQNLFTLNRNKYQFDPETNVPGGPPGLGTGQYAAVPPLRTLVVGINVSF
ncbi:MAG TPA: TonB-dependent receptor [Arachidicoccus soli]|nr:TonB-dependent receptor [Arachidicoccus soli]